MADSFIPDSFKPDEEKKPQYAGAPDLPLPPGAGDVTDQTVAKLWRILGAVAPTVAGPAGFAPAVAVSGLSGAAGGAMGAIAEDKPVGEGAVKGGLAGAVSVPISRILGALAGVGASKLAPKMTQEVALPRLGAAAEDVSARGGLAPPAAKGAADTVKEWLGASGGRLPINAQGAAPSIEKIRQGLPYKRVGGTDMYGALRQDVAKGAPAYDKLLQQYRSVHTLFDTPTMKELIGTGVVGSGGYFNGVPEAALLPVLLRVLNAARYAPPAPVAQAGLAGLGAALSQ